ncbi:MAG: glycosyltransferase family 4 protein [Candidatus Moranbacteria bacterium]|jgi:glycosyltransferase involved in cell wall biosynthesis|nr:glycosyltransferase family 4 protein [Candidatus Moranbacteria bacterium]
MKILWFTWKDLKNPLAGGAEVVNEELAKRLVADGHTLTFLVGSFVGCKEVEMVDGYKIIRMGNRYTVYLWAMIYYLKNLRGQADLVIDEINTAPFFARFYVKERNIIFIHQLCREIWFYQLFFPFSLMGYLLEPVYLWLLSSGFQLSTLWTFKTFDSPQVITVSESTKKDLLKYGFKKENIHIISEGTIIAPIDELEFESQKSAKYEMPTVLSLGAVRAMKRTDQIVRAFEIAKGKIKDLRLLVSGDASDSFGKKVLAMIEKSEFKDSISVLGRTSDEEREELMRKSHLICATSIKEGWGLVVTEANSQGTPAVVYDVDGLRDSVRDGETGLICRENTPENLAENIVKLLSDGDEYEKNRRAAHAWSKDVNFDKSYEDFKKVIESVKLSSP